MRNIYDARPRQVGTFEHGGRLTCGGCLICGVSTPAVASEDAARAVVSDSTAASDRDCGDAHDYQRQSRTDRADFDPLPPDLSAWAVWEEQEDERAQNDDSDSDDEEDGHAPSVRSNAPAVN